MRSSPGLFSTFELISTAINPLMKALKLENEALSSKQKALKSKQKTNGCADEAMPGLVRCLALTNKLVRDCTMYGE